MKITFVRHGETEHNKTGRITGEIDADLNDEGIAQAEQLAKEIPSEFDCIYTSTLKRARDTANIVNGKLSLPVIVSSLIVERHFGSLAGKSWSDAEVLYPNVRDLDKKQEYDFQPFGGESAKDVRTRLFAFIDEVKQGPYTHPLVITHGGILRMLHFLHAKEMGHIANASLHTFEF
ncbi:MAG: histidine phosphatase family protein [Candidatus Taylorbacteria bacterium CG11_big_fil_rev_8_21_14_0_20_46_11]|uniref:Histidine phosphatase family protein n=1 Tax=Candidatus Taylorbacteria bacterium CG11_big_fil_rev_8_21_14_0_20_46_11 TaxID=1975025 RepID=A0A2H0KCG3_9BACT|nr:MAG: histidine phosphatase family protein [Candidatus Taylorbacteria bacterium CG11_big_fil_rev_8_21_14_0_20_46_11]